MASLSSPDHAKKTKLSDGTTYGYVYIKAQSSKPTLLLIHGYPASSYDWRHQIVSLSEAGFGVLAVDCLGYGDTDKPSEIEAYNLKRLSGHFNEILDKEGLDKVVGVGHDWGCGVLSRVNFYYPDRFSKLVFVNVGYNVPARFLDIDEINAQTLLALGYPVFGYWYFFNAGDTASLLEKNIESHFSLAFLSDWTRNLSPLAAARRYVTENRTEPLPSWISEEERETWIKIFKGPMDGPLNYYKGVMRGVTNRDEASTPDVEERKKLKVPVMFIGGTKDTVCLADPQSENTKPWATAGFRDERLDAGHWTMLQKKKEFGKLLADFAGQ